MDGWVWDFSYGPPVLKAILFRLGGEKKRRSVKRMQGRLGERQKMVKTGYTARKKGPFLYLTFIFLTGLENHSV